MVGAARGGASIVAWLSIAIVAIMWGGCAPAARSAPRRPIPPSARPDASPAPHDTLAPAEPAPGLVEQPAAAVEPGNHSHLPELALPPRPEGAPTGSAFFEKTKDLKQSAFEAAAVAEIIAGNVPSFLRRFAPVTVERTFGGEVVSATVYVLRDYLAIGSDSDFIRIPLGASNAQRVATAADCVLPTKLLVDEIYRQADERLPPRWIEGGPTYADRSDYLRHHVDVEAQRSAAASGLGSLRAGTMKDVVLTNKLVTREGRVAIYGWHRPNGEPIQPLSTVHSARYADYSHGVRLIRGTMVVADREMRVSSVMRSPRLSALVSDEGPLEFLAYPVGSAHSPASATGAARKVGR